MFFSSSYRLATATSSSSQKHGVSRATNALLRTPRQPRAGRLESSHLFSWKDKDVTNEWHPLFYSPDHIGDTVEPHTGLTSYWRDVMDRRSDDEEFSGITHKSAWRAPTGASPPTWDFVVPLLESIREHGRVLYGASRARPHAHSHGHVSPWNSGFAAGADVYNDVHSSQIGSSMSGAQADRLVENGDRPRLELLPLGDRVTADAVRKQFEIELFVRLPLLEQSLATTCTPQLLGRLCAMLGYGGVALPSLADIAREKKQGSSFNACRLRTLLASACRRCEAMMHADRQRLERPGSSKSKMKEDSDLRKARRLALESPMSAALHVALFAPTQSLLCESEPEMSALSIQLEECPILVSWARSGFEYQKNIAESQQQQQLTKSDEKQGGGDMFELFETPRSPVDWKPGGKLNA